MQKKAKDKTYVSQKEEYLLIIPINEFNDNNSVFCEYKNDDPNTLFFRRTCQSICCWGKTHSMNGFLLKYNKDTKQWYYYSYGEECNKKLFKIGDENKYDEEDVSSILEKMENMDYFDE